MGSRSLSVVLVLVAGFAAEGSGDSAAGPDGIAVSTHRKGGGDHGFGVAPSIFADLVRHDIKEGRVAKSTVIYAGRARGARIGFAGDKVVFLKLDGRICVINVDGSGLRELSNTKNHNASAVDWPAGDWVYYSEEGSSPDGAWNEREKDDTPDKRTIRRVNVVSGEDELVGVVPQRIWQLSTTANATTTSGKFTVTGALLDFSNLGRKLNNRGLACGTAVSMNGLYVTEMADSHADIKVWDWDLRTLLKQFHVNEWAAKPSDGREFFYRPRWAVNSDKWIVMTQGNDFGCTTQTNMVLYNWHDGQQIQVTNNLLTGSECDEGEDFWLAGVASDFAIGGLEGEAPFTVELHSGKLAGGPWEWDYGDGTGKRAAAGKHTFDRPGRYTATARRGGQVLRQAVNVFKRRPPTATAQPLDGLHVLMEFDEPVQLKDAKATLASGILVENLALGALSRDLLISLQAPLPRRDKLSLEGVFDLAQVPNPLADSSFRISLPEWPSDRTGLVFMWETDKKRSFQFDPGRKWFDPVRMNTWRRARFDRVGAMLLEGGVVFATGAGAGISERCHQTNQWSIEAVITPASLHQGQTASPRRIIGCARGGGEEASFSIDQQSGKLSAGIAVKTGNDGPRVRRTVLGDLAADVPNHLIVSYAPGRLMCWLNGKLSLQAGDVDGQLAWDQPPYADGLHFGGRERTPFPWRGTIEGVAIHARAIEADEAARDYAAYASIIKSRPVIARTRLLGTLATKAAVPKPEEISPYRDALVVYEYDVKQVLQGKYRGKRIRVAHWGLIDVQPTPTTRTPPGTECELLVERLADHPELEGQPLREPDGNLELAIFVDVANGPSGEPKLVSLSIGPQEVWLPVGMPVQFAATALDQYGERISVPLIWRATAGGSIDLGTAYGAGHYFVEARQPGEGTIDDKGLFSGTKAGTVTITLTSDRNPAVVGRATVGVGDYPAIYPAKALPLTIGRERDGMQGDIDRLRMYDRCLTPEEIAEHAAGRGLDKAPGLVADWTFDALEDGAYANAAGEGLAAKVVGEVQHADDKDARYVRLTRKGWLQVAPDPRLDASSACTYEAWVRPTGSGYLLFRQVVWMWGFVVWLDLDGIGIDAFRTDGGGLRGGFVFPKDTWTHLAAVFAGSGVWKIYVNGKLLAERRPWAAPVR